MLNINKWRGIELNTFKRTQLLIDETVEEEKQMLR